MILAATAGAAAAQGVTAWSDAPTYAEAAVVYPAKAKAAGVAGGAKLTCTVSYSRALRNCEILNESPAGYRLGQAARDLATRLKVARGAGVASNAEVEVDIAFPAQLAGHAPYVAPDPVWMATPSAADFQATFPKAENGVNQVKVVLLCDVADGGALSGCGVESETPAGQGYGAGALALAPKIRVGLLSASGVPLVGAKVRVPVRYELTPVKP
ncbi:energy transducer TonB [Phenylobacterium soli]|nr:energy transducer TonB [Phenylobacterium soli]